MPGSDPILHVELVPDGDVLPNLGTVKTRRDDKEVFDQLKAWWSFRHGRELRQWEAFNLLLVAALENRGADLPRRGGRL